VDDFDAAVKRARALRAKVLLEPRVIPAPGHRELWLCPARGGRAQRSDGESAGES